MIIETCTGIFSLCNDVIGYLITCYADTLGLSNATQRNSRNLSTSSSNIDNHVTHRSKDIKADS